MLLVRQLWSLSFLLTLALGLSNFLLSALSISLLARLPVLTLTLLILQPLATLSLLARLTYTPSSIVGFVSFPLFLGLFAILLRSNSCFFSFFLSLNSGKLRLCLFETLIIALPTQPISCISLSLKAGLDLSVYRFLRHKSVPLLILLGHLLLSVPVVLDLGVKLGNHLFPWRHILEINNHGLIDIVLSQRLLIILNYHVAVHEFYFSIATFSVSLLDSGLLKITDDEVERIVVLRSRSQELWKRAAMTVTLVVFLTGGMERTCLDHQHPLPSTFFQLFIYLFIGPMSSSLE